MKEINTILQLLIFVFLTTFIISPCWGNQFDFRQTKWGISKEEVLLAESSSPLVKDKDSVTYNTIVLKKMLS